MEDKQVGLGVLIRTSLEEQLLLFGDNLKLI